MHLAAVNQPQQQWNESGMADGLVGDYLPTALFYIPVSQVSAANCSDDDGLQYCNISTRVPNCNSKHKSAQCAVCQKELKPYCGMDQAWGVNNGDPSKCLRCVKQLVNNTSYGNEHRYWTYLNIPKADMGTSREQGTWMRFQQVACAGANMTPPCRLLDWPMYWDTMWFSRFPGANASDTAYQTLATGPANASSSSGFYRALLTLRQWWRHELAAEGMMQMQLPSPTSTNGTYLATQAVHSIIKSMITRQRTFHPRFGVKPGFGSDNTHGYPDVMSSTVTAALEMGALPYAKGVAANYFLHYVRDDGMIHLPGIALPATCRVLTALALLHGYLGGNAADTLLLTFFPKAKALAEWLASRRQLSVVHPAADPRYGIPQGEAHVDDTVQSYKLHTRKPPYLYASAAEMYRAFSDIGAVWQAVGQAVKRDDVTKHGNDLIGTAAELLHDLHASLNRTVHATGVATAPRCWPVEIDVLVFTENLLENTDRVLHQCSLGAVACDLPFMLTAALLVTPSNSEGLWGWTAWVLSLGALPPLHSRLPESLGRTRRRRHRHRKRFRTANTLR